PQSVSGQLWSSQAPYTPFLIILSLIFQINRIGHQLLKFIRRDTVAFQMANVLAVPIEIDAGHFTDNTISVLDNLRSNGFLAFDTSCFTIPPVGAFGNAGRDVLNGPGLQNWDLGFEKFFPLTAERTRLDFRAELFNAFNHANFGQPNANSGDGVNFGRVSSARTPRLIQFSAKLFF